MRPILSIGLIALLLCTAGCTNPVSKIIDKLTDDEPATSQQSTTTSAPTPPQTQTREQPTAQQQNAAPAAQQAQPAAPVASPAGNTAAPTTAAAPAKAVAEETRTVPAVHTEDTPTEESARPAAASSGKSLLIKKSKFRLYLLEDGNIVQSWPVALGKNAGQKRVSGDMKTPDGTFPIDEVIDSSDWTHDFGDGRGEIEGAYGPYFISLDTSALSGGAWDGIGIHGTHDPASIGTCASEGCIRMHNSDLLVLKAQIDVGTEVTIEE